MSQAVAVKPNLVRTGANARTRLDSAARAELLFCDAVERLADGLPFSHPAPMRRAAEILMQAAEAEDAFDCMGLLRTARRAPHIPHPVRRAAQRLHAENARDSDLALELAEALQRAAGSDAPESAALGYLMRSYFEARRRHHGWKRLAVVEPLSDRLSDSAAGAALALDLTTPAFRWTFAALC